MSKQTEYRQLVDEAVELGKRLSAVKHAGDIEHRWMVTNLIARNSMRITRRRYNLSMLIAGRPVVTAKQVYDWMRQHIDIYRWLPDGDCEVFADKAAQAMGLAGDDGHAPSWFLAIAWNVTNRDDNEQACPVEIVHDAAFFAPKAIQYEPDGDVIWA